MIEAGSETTSATLNSCLLYLCANPEVQKIAQKELDSALQGRSPTFDDEDALPYCRSIVKEILRLRPVANIGSPRRSDEDVVYKDMFIPKGTNITLFQYALHYNPARWNNPEKFDPSRYLDYPLKSGDYAGIADVTKRDHFSFGCGRRICPGLHLAEQSLFITISRILWAFDILPGLDDSGNEIKPDTQGYEPGLSLTSPKPFKARFVVRDEEKRRMILEEWKEAQKKGYTILGDKVRIG
jgi:cytochrome P450